MRLEEARTDFDRDGGDGTFRARVVASSFDMFETVYVTVYLLGDGRQPIASIEAPVKLLASHRPQDLAIPVPAPLANATTDVDYRVKLGPRLSTAVAYETRTVERVMVENNRTAFRVEAYNPLTTTAKRSLFVVTATDDDGRLLEKWIIDWSEPVGPKQRIETAVITALKADANAANWSITGVAVP